MTNLLLQPVDWKIDEGPLASGTHVWTSKQRDPMAEDHFRKLRMP